MAVVSVGFAQSGGTTKPRARELGLSARIGGTPGKLDAITDVAGVEVGQTTLISGAPPLIVGKGLVRTYQFKGGIGTASRVLTAADGAFTVGVLVQCNYCTRSWLRVARC